MMAGPQSRPGQADVSCQRVGRGRRRLHPPLRVFAAKTANDRHARLQGLLANS